MAGYVLSAEAAQSLDEIEDYTDERWGADQAARYIALLFATFERLTDEPQIGRRRADLPPSFLAYPVGAHVVVYRVGPDDRVGIVTVVHPAMDVPRRLADALRRARARR